MSPDAICGSSSDSLHAEAGCTLHHLPLTLSKDSDLPAPLTARFLARQDHRNSFFVSLPPRRSQLSWLPSSSFYSQLPTQTLGIFLVNFPFSPYLLILKQLITVIYVEKDRSVDSAVPIGSVILESWDLATLCSRNRH